MKKDVTITAHDGGSFSAYVAYPEGDLPAGAVVVIQEIFGVNAVMRGICDNLALAGFIAICPDLFWRQQPGVQLTDKSEAEWAQAFALYKGFDVDHGIDDLKATLAFIRADEHSTGKAGTIGYCLGGMLAYLMSTRSDAECNVSYYGVGIQDLLGEADKIGHQLLMHIAEKDKFVPMPAQQKILAALNKHKNVEINVYPDVDHAFAREGGEHYDKEAARMANARTADFLATNLAKGRRA
ncbi:MAG TPA: dienelactone hydrolase family protein [Patescibacteria group bacterium]|nr:dienelactone hydrolase family protein [Patescibacteria group bacterium]